MGEISLKNHIFSGLFSGFCPPSIFSQNPWLGYSIHQCSTCCIIHQSFESTAHGSSHRSPPRTSLPDFRIGDVEAVVRMIVLPRGRFCAALPCRYPCPCRWTCPSPCAFLTRPEHYTFAAAAGALPKRRSLLRWVWVAFSSLEAAGSTDPPRTSAAPCPRTCGAVPGTTGKIRYYDQL